MPEGSDRTSQESRQGRIVTFYSYKGGTGRTMALANVAWILAANGRRVLVADWDLESPGLHRFFHPFLDESEVREASGIIDLIRQYERTAARADDPDEAIKLIPERAKLLPHVLSLDWTFPGDGGLDFLSAGRQNIDYAATLASLDWDNFYERLNGGKFLDAVRTEMKLHYDYVLIDSRTGLSDIAGICTIQLPDVLVDCFTFSTQGIEGAAQVARTIEERHKDRSIQILPVPMRVDPAEKEKVDAGHAVAVRLFAGLPTGRSEAQRRDYWAAVEVPYRAFYAYEETLAVFGDAPGSPASLLSSFERLAAQITEGQVTVLPPMDERLRNRTKLLFTRSAPPADFEIIVEFNPEAQVWGEWIADVLRAAGVAASERPLVDALGTGSTQDAGRTLTVVSAAYLAQRRAQSATPSAPDLPVYVTAPRPPAAFPASQGAFVAGVTEREAIERICRLVGIPERLVVDRSRSNGVRFPGIDPRTNTAPVHNVRFTGREEDLRQVRAQLLDTAETRPVAILGMAGIGKTQVAIEYVNRFRTEYDIVWWMNCGQPQFIDASLADLASRISKDFGFGDTVTQDAAKAARNVLQLLEQGKTGLRWLLVFDSADDIGAVEPLLPPGGGHVLITSRNRDWAEKARVLPLDVFTRQESIAHLSTRLPSIGEEEAAKVAVLLGDLPLAVATAGAWLAESGTPVADYVDELERRAPHVLSLTVLADYPESVPHAWDLSLKLLEQRSPAAARLFELCSVVAPNISTELIYSSAMAKVLEPYDPELAEPMVIGRLIKEIDRTALIKIDHNSHQIQVHGLVQAVVRDGMSPDQEASARSDMHRVLAASRPSRGIDNPETWDRFRLIWPHLDPSQAMRSLDEQVRQLSIDRVRYLWHRRDLENGRVTATAVNDCWEEMLAAAPSAGSAESIRRQQLQLRFNLANILRDQASFAVARALDQSVLAEQRELLGDNHPHSLMTAGSLAADLRAIGDYHSALNMDMATYPAWTRLYGEGDVRTLAAANNLAVSYRLTGDCVTALRLDEDTLQRRRATLGPRHPQALISASNVVRDLLEAGEYSEAVARTGVLRDDAEQGLGADSPAFLNSELLMGIALRSAGDPRQGEPHFHVAYEGLSRQSGGATSSESLACRLGHAVNLLAIERAAEAEAEIRPVLDVYEERLGPGHPHTLVCMIDLACALRLQERFIPATQQARPAVVGLREVLGDTHPYTLAATSVLGVLLTDQGELRQAETVETQTVEGLISALGASHPDTLRCLANLLLTRKQLGISGAAEELDGTINDLEDILGPGHPHVGVLRREGRLMHTLDPQPF